MTLFAASRGWLIRLFCLVGVMVLLWPSGVIADDEWETSRFKGARVQSVVIRGLDEQLAESLRDGLALAQIGNGVQRTRPTFYPQVLLEDVERCRLFLARHGYPYATVAPSVSASKERVIVTFDIVPGPPVRIHSVVVTGIPPAIHELPSDAVLVGEGDVCTDAAVAQSVEALQTFVVGQGFAKATVASQINWRDKTTVDVRFQTTAGERYYFGDTRVSGAPADIVPLIKKTVRARRGRLYSPKVLDDSTKDLRVLDLFRQVAVGVDEVARDTLDVIVEVVMREERTFQFAVRWWTDERLHGSASWMHRNLFGRGRGGIAWTTASVYRQETKLSAWWPAILWARSRAVLTLGAEREDEEAYESASAGVELALRHHFSLETTYRMSIGVSNVDIREKSPDVPYEGQTGLLTVLAFSWERNGRNDWVTPTAGTYVRWPLEYAPEEPLSQTSFVLTEPQGMVYVPLSKRSTVAFRVGLGAAWPLGTSEALIATRRFYSGGGNSMRGFGRRRLGPKDSAGTPIGGEAELEASVELRFPLFWKFRGTTFVDAGQIWPKIHDVDRRVEFAIGPGFWLNTIVGPLRVDYGYRLTNHDPTEPRSVWHFSIGPAF